MPTLGEDVIFNGKDRVATAEAFAYALYLGSVQGGEFKGIHQGFVGTPEEAEAWVRGEHVEHIIKLYAQS